MSLWPKQEKRAEVLLRSTHDPWLPKGRAILNPLMTATDVQITYGISDECQGGILLLISLVRRPEPNTLDRKCLSSISQPVRPHIYVCVRTCLDVISPYPQFLNSKMQIPPVLADIAPVVITSAASARQ